MENYIVTHLHTDFSSGTTNIDSITKYDAYINYASTLGMKAIAFTEHGNIFSWVKKKETCEKYGLKYIHAVETYITESLDDKIRDNYHTCLYALNYDGVLELNRLISNAFNREDGHYYYHPRITIDEFCNISDNIAVATACTGGVLACGNNNIKQLYLDYIIKNKHRCFLEIQHHNTTQQIEHNKYLYELSQKHDLKLIAGTDTHCLNSDHVEGRKILQKAKNIRFDNEDGWDLSFKTYGELIEAYENQNTLPMNVVKIAINNTNVLADMVEVFTLDRSHKYPKLYDNSEQVLKKKIANGVVWRGVNKEPNFDEYVARINKELETYKVNGAIDFLLLEEDYKAEMRKNGVFCGYSRGSVSGSVIAYVLGITEIDSIKHKLNFERFMHDERVTLGDVDTDWYSEDRPKVKKYLYDKKGLYCCDIITFNTIALKGSIRDVGRALGIELETINDICKNINDFNENSYRKDFPELFRYADLLNGVIVSVGSHPAGTIVSPYPLDEAIGVFTTGTNDYPISQINMKEVDGLSFLKLDVLSLDNIGTINKTCQLAGIERLTPNNTNGNDIDVWKSIRDNTLGIFQWESDSASAYLKELLSDNTVENIKSNGVNFSYMDLFSIGNSAIRPAGESYRNELAKGIVKDHGHPALNEFMSNTIGYLVYQEQIIEFLNKFCGYSMGEADMVRRNFSKKIGTEEDIPRIKAGFIKTMAEKYDTPYDEAERIVESFLQVIIDASNYLFSLNHSDPYSWIGYICGYLRYYYPLEFLTTMFNINSDDIEKTDRIKQYCYAKGIKINNPKFRYSKGDYFFNKEANAIYKGIGSIKGLGVKDGEQLYLLKDNKYDSFLDLYHNLVSNTAINKGKIEILIKLDYFSEFGGSQKLLDIVGVYNNIYGKKQFSKDKIDELGLTLELISKYAGLETAKLFKEIDSLGIINELVLKIEDREIPLKDKLDHQREMLGYIDYVDETMTGVVYLAKVEYNSYGTPYFDMYNLSNAKSANIKVDKEFVMEYEVKTGDFIRIKDIKTKPKKRKNKQTNKWEVIGDEFILNSYTILQNF